MRKAIKMKQIVFYCSGRNELPPPRIDGIQFFPERASMWDELSKRLPDVSISVWFTPPGEFAVDMGNIQTNETVSAYKPVRSPERVAYRFLDGTESVEEIAGKIAETHPDVAIAFSIPIMPYDWSALRDAMVGEELRRRGIKTISHSTRFALESFQRGEADHKGVRSMLRMGLWYALLPCSIYAIVFMISAVPLARFFHGENERLMNMTAAIIRGYAFSFPLVAICQIIESYLNVIGKRWLSAIVSMLEGGIAWIVFSWLLRQAEPAGRIWLGHLIGEFSLVFAIAVVILFCRNLNRQKELLTDRENDTVELETTVYTFGEASVFSESVRKSCLNHGISSRISMLSALCVEEAACNTLRWGFSEETDCAVDIRAVCRNGEIIIRFRDSGRRFNPKSYISQVLVYDKNPAGNIGLRTISNIMSEMQYMCIMDCNILLIHIR